MAAALLTLLHRAARLPAPAAEADRTATPERAPRMLPQWLGPVALSALILFLRKPELLLKPQFWQEDALFFEQNYHHGWHAIFIPYAGYLHVVLRLVAWTAGFLPLVLQPALYNAATAALCLAVIARIFRPGIRLPHKWLLALTVLLVQRDLYGEILGNLTNIQWFLALVPVLMLVEETVPTGWRAAWDLVQLGLVGLSGPFVLLSIPLFAVKWVRAGRSRWNTLCLSVATFCGAVQAWFIHRQPDLPVGTPTLDQWLSYLAKKPLGPIFFGRAFTVDHLAPMGAVAVLLALVILLIALNRRQPAWLWPTFLFTSFGGTLLLASVSRFIRNPDANLLINNADRYFFVPRLMLIWCLLLHLRAHVGWRRGLLWATLALATMATAADFVCQAPPDGRWVDQVAAFERGKLDSLKTIPKWRIYMDHPLAPGDGYADILGAAPLQIIPPKDGARVLIGAEPFLQLRSAKAEIVYEAPAQSRAVAGRYALAPGTDGGAEFSVFYFPEDSDKVQLLWRGRLDPANVPADRGAHEFEAALPPFAVGRIVFSSLSMSDDAPAVGCWADIRFR